MNILPRKTSSFKPSFYSRSALLFSSNAKLKQRTALLEIIEDSPYKFLNYKGPQR
jgi:hypothetical protein